MNISLLILLMGLGLVISGCGGGAVEPAPFEPLATASPGEQEVAMLFGFIPYLSPTRLEAIWDPVLADFNRSSAFNLQFRTSNSFDDFNLKLNSSGFDVALVQPFDYIKIPSGMYEPLVRFDEPLTGIFVVGPDSDIRDLAGLAGKTVATPPDTAAVTILAEITLNNIGVENVIFFHQTSHDQCLHLVLIAEVDACLTNVVPLRTFEQALNQALTIVGNTLEIPHAVIVVRDTTVSDQEKERLAGYFLGLNSYEAGQKLLADVGIHGFVEATDSDYDIVRMYWAEFMP